MINPSVEIEASGLHVLWMTPLEAREAARMLGSETFERVVDLIRRHDLAKVAGYPRVLSFLKDWRGDGTLSVADVWEAILKDLLKEYNHVKRGRFRTELEDRFEAVSRIAVVLTLMRQQDLAGSQVAGPGPSIEDVFPLTSFSRRPEALRRAARESFQLGPFCSTPDGGYRFVQRNIRDWFCAFGLREHRLDQLRAMVADDHGPLSHLVDMLHLLRQVSKDAQVPPIGSRPHWLPWGRHRGMCRGVLRRPCTGRQARSDRHTVALEPQPAR